MATRKLERSEWRQYFDAAAKQLPKMRVAISVMAEDLGAQQGELASIEVLAPDGTKQIIELEAID